MSGSTNRTSVIRKTIRFGNCAALDAPLVGAVWAFVLSDQQAGPIPAFSITIVSVSIWLVYAADHWIDGQRVRDIPRAPRHAFGREHPRTFVSFWITVLLSTVTVAFVFGSARFLFRGLLVLSAAILYFILIHSSRSIRIRFAAFGFKEVSTAAFMWVSTAAVAPREPVLFHPLAIGAFSLFLLNALAVSRTERNPTDSVWAKPMVARAWLVAGVILLGFTAPGYPVLAIAAAVLLALSAIPGLLNHYPSLADLAIAIPPFLSIQTGIR